MGCSGSKAAAAAAPRRPAAAAAAAGGADAADAAPGKAAAAPTAIPGAGAAAAVAVAVAVAAAAAAAPPAKPRAATAVATSATAASDSASASGPGSPHAASSALSPDSPARDAAGAGGGAHADPDPAAAAGSAASSSRSASGSAHASGGSVPPSAPASAPVPADGEQPLPATEEEERSRDEAMAAPTPTPTPPTSTAAPAAPTAPAAPSAPTPADGDEAPAAEEGGRPAALSKASSTASVGSPTSAFRRRVLEEEYELGKRIGMGHYASVYLATNRKTGERVAVKRIEKRLTHEDRLGLEIDVMRRVGTHPNIVRLIDVFETQAQVQLVLEYVEGGELFQYLVEHGPYSEADAARHVRAVTSAVAFLHSHNIVHRDIKPENIMLTTHDAAATVKVADFGLAKLMHTDLTRTVCGTWAYAAPDILLKKGHDAKVDVWSIGVVTYVLLSAYHPFDPNGDSPDTVIWQRVCKGYYDFNDAAWEEVSDEAKDFVRACLQMDPKKRPTAAELLSHAWIRNVADTMDAAAAAAAAADAAATAASAGAGAAGSAEPEPAPGTAPLSSTIDQRLAHFQDQAKATRGNPFLKTVPAFFRSVRHAVGGSDRDKADKSAAAGSPPSKARDGAAAAASPVLAAATAAAAADAADAAAAAADGLGLHVSAAAAAPHGADAGDHGAAQGGGGAGMDEASAGAQAGKRFAVTPRPNDLIVGSDASGAAGATAAAAPAPASAPAPGLGKPLLRPALSAVAEEEGDAEGAEDEDELGAEDLAPGRGGAHPGRAGGSETPPSASSSPPLVGAAAAAAAGGSVASAPRVMAAHRTRSAARSATASSIGSVGNTSVSSRAKPPSTLDRTVSEPDNMSQEATLSLGGVSEEDEEERDEEAGKEEDEDEGGDASRKANRDHQGQHRQPRGAGEVDGARAHP